MTLAELRNTKVDMFTTVFIGNSQTKEIPGSHGNAEGDIAMNKVIVFAGTTEGREILQFSVRNMRLHPLPVRRQNTASAGSRRAVP